MSIEAKTYTGWIRLECEDVNGLDDILFVLPERKGGPSINDEDTLARQIETGIDQYGRYLSVQYFVSDEELSSNDLQTAWVNQVMGIGDAEYRVCYSDYTGYLWTDEEIKVGGHDLLEEIKGHAGKYLRLIIEYSKESGQ